MVPYQKAYQTNKGPYLDLIWILYKHNNCKKTFKSIREIRVMRIINVKRYDFDIVAINVF